jgi:hypothetical protein
MPVRPVYYYSISSGLHHALLESHRGCSEMRQAATAHLHKLVHLADVGRHMLQLLCGQAPQALVDVFTECLGGKQRQKCKAGLP